ncbi:S-adenosyl-L-methionine-dependent methyltransferase [Fennellomyces sp. T-0311]|nr:S-adenosyl-L-methionine-dependent methyltransferase [Fennellomyces sp. T-0311]
MAAQLLSRWKQSPISNQLCLDLRSPQAYQLRHLAPSTNIPWHQLQLRCAELPPKNIPFAVIEPHDTPGECCRWLEDHGWQCPYVFQEDDDAFWTAAQRYIQPDPMPPKPWLLFKPCPFLTQHMDWIEKKSGRTCLDIGCGSGRDVAWLLSRGWNVYALDSLKGAVERTQQLAQNMGVDDRLLACVQAKIMADGKWKTFDEPAPDDKRAKFSPGIPASAFFERLGSSKFDMILTIRFLVRSLLPQLPQLLNVGGYLVMSHFVEDGVHTYDQPRKDHRLQLGELATLYGSMQNMEVVVDVIEQIEDGRPVNSVIIKKTGA